MRMKDIYRHESNVTVKAIHTCDCSTAIAGKQSYCCAEFFLHSQPASTAQHKRARHCDDLPRPAFKVQFRLPGEATPHRNQPYCYWLFCPAFACALIWIGNPSDNSTSTSCEVFVDS